MKAADRRDIFRRDNAKRYLSTMEIIVVAPRFHAFMIGYTSRPLIKRRYEHAFCEFAHLVLVADKMAYNDALDLEITMQRMIKRGDKGSALYKRYDPKALADYSRRSGHKLGDDGLKLHGVYMVWREAPVCP